LVIGSRGIKYQSFDPGAALIGYIYMEKSGIVSANACIRQVLPNFKLTGIDVQVT